MSQRNAGNCNSLLWKVQDYWIVWIVLCPCLLGLWGFSDRPVTTLVSRESAELIAPDVLAQPQQPVLLSARLVKTRLFMQTGLGGESLHFLVDGTSIGQSMTGVHHQDLMRIEHFDDLGVVVEKVASFGALEAPMANFPVQP